MTVTITTTNHKIPTSTWEKFTRDQLRSLARKHGIARGRDKKETAFYISYGYNTDNPKERITFDVELTIDL